MSDTIFMVPVCIGELHVVFTVPLLCIKATFVHIIVTNTIGVTYIAVVFGMHYLRTDRLVDRSNLHKLPLPRALVASTAVLSVVEMHVY